MTKFEVGKNYILEAEGYYKLTYRCTDRRTNFLGEEVVMFKLVGIEANESYDKSPVLFSIIQENYSFIEHNHLTIRTDSLKTYELVYTYNINPDSYFMLCSTDVENN